MRLRSTSPNAKASRHAQLQGICEEITPALFSGHDDGLWYVKEKEWADIYNGGPKDAPVYRMAEGQATVPENLVESAIESAEECPGECIFIEVLD